MRVITEENEDFNKNILKPLTKPLEKVAEKAPPIPATIPEQNKVFIPDSKAYKPKIRGISPKYFHEQIVKKIDDNKRTGITFIFLFFVHQRGRQDYMGGGGRES